MKSEYQRGIAREIATEALDKPCDSRVRERSPSCSQQALGITEDKASRALSNEANEQDVKDKLLLTH